MPPIAETCPPWGQHHLAKSVSSYEVETPEALARCINFATDHNQRGSRISSVKAFQCLPLVETPNTGLPPTPILVPYIAPTQALHLTHALLLL